MTRGDMYSVLKCSIAAADTLRKLTDIDEVINACDLSRWQKELLSDWSLIRRCQIMSQQYTDAE